MPRPMSDRPNPSPGPASGVPGFIKIIGFLSFSLSVALVLLAHHYLTTWKCPIPQ
ncbi:MAG TPA: hypothetical protein VFH69_08790 [Gemmatimonadota bacterium]|nr:hypothetical protein [Gemmatimonadota bacterium]